MEMDSQLTNDINPLTYYGYALTSRPDDARHEKWRKQRNTFGFDSSVLWCLDLQIITFIVPKLKMALEGNNPLSIKTKYYWKQNIEGEHTHLDKNRSESIKILTKMIEGFELYLQQKIIYTKEEQKKMNKAFKLLFKHFHGLWC